MRAQIRLLVCDLDNTLYDWVTFFARAFYSMVDAALPILNVQKSRLLDELQSVHRRYGSSEPPFALLETPSVARRFPGCSRDELHDLLNPAFHAFNSARKAHLRAYPGVESCLSELKNARTTVVAHTEATVVNAEYRLRKLDLLRFFSRIYAVENVGPGHPNPHRLERQQRTHELRVLRLQQRKPDTRVLQIICADAGVDPAQALYVGDSISRDIGMANSAGVCSAWAKYGTMYEEADWNKLVRITHWTDEDVRRATEARERYGDAEPDVVLEKRFDEVLEHFEFVAP